MEPRLLAYQSGTLTITPNCFLCLCEAIIEPYSCLGDSSQFIEFIEFNENLFILEKLDRTSTSILRADLVFTGRNKVLAKVIFLHLSVILFTGGYLTRHPPPLGPGRYTPPDQAGTPPPEQTPPGADTPQDPAGTSPRE